MTSTELFAKLSGLTERVNHALKSILEDDQGFFGEVGVYSLVGGGKRLRPLIFCLTCASLGGKVDDDALKQASGFELLHMATLMHDDIIDQSDTRRGRSAVHRVFGIPETVMAADYLVAKAGEMTLHKSNLETMRMMIALLRELSLGELAELKARRQVDLPASGYMEIIYRKTAALMETVGKSAAAMVEAPPRAAKAAADYGRLMGLGFQIVDDVLDYRGRPGNLGKPVGQDLAEGRITLPFIRARETLSGADRRRLLELGAEDDLSAENLAEATSLVEKGRGIELAMEDAAKLAKEAAEALEALAPSAERNLLAELAAYAVDRDR
jgi:octaprenyl-diphosphate synthase